MNVGDERDPVKLSRAEVSIALPRAHGAALVAKLNEPGNKLYEPIKLTKRLARFPHDYRTWFGIGHTVPLGGPIFARRNMNGVLLHWPTSWPETSLTFTGADGDVVRFLGVYPLFPGEMAMKLEQGTDALLDRLDAAGVTDVLDLKRRDTSRRRLFGLF